MVACGLSFFVSQSTRQSCISRFQPIPETGFAIRSERTAEACAKVWCFRLFRRAPVCRQESSGMRIQAPSRNKDDCSRSRRGAGTETRKPSSPSEEILRSAVPCFFPPPSSRALQRLPLVPGCLPGRIGKAAIWRPQRQVSDGKLSTWPTLRDRVAAILRSRVAGLRPLYRASQITKSDRRSANCCGATAQFQRIGILSAIAAVRSAPPHW